MKTSMVGISVAVLSLGATVWAAEQTIPAQVKGDLVALQGKKVSRFDDASLAGAKYIAVYYSASWCGPCKTFTPKLVEFYNRVKPAHPEFELVFVSRDQSEPEMEAYMKTDKMPWPALSFRKATAGKHPLTKYAGPGIPCLVLLDEQGKVLSDSYVEGKYVGPNKVMSDIEAALKTSPAAANATPGTAAASTTGPTATASGTVKPASPQGSKFDDFFKKKAQ